MFASTSCGLRHNGRLNFRQNRHTARGSCVLANRNQHLALLCYYACTSQSSTSDDAPSPPPPSFVRHGVSKGHRDALALGARVLLFLR